MRNEIKVWGRVKVGGLLSALLVLGLMPLSGMSWANSTEAERKAAFAVVPPIMDDASMQAMLDARIAEKRAVGIAVALIEPDGKVRLLNAGARSADATATPGPQPVAADTIFEIGSITKAFTGVLLAQMAARGEVKLADPVRMHAPKDVLFPPGGAGDITLLQLATHTSGLPRLPISMAFMRSMAVNPSNPYAAYSRADFWHYLTSREHDAQKTYPSEYSNLGMGLLGELLAARAGLSYADLVKRNILEPLGMKDTFIALPTPSSGLAARMAVGHDDKLKPVAYWELPTMQGAGALRSTATDIAIFIAAAMSGRVQDGSGATEPRATMNERNSVGLGWMILKSRGDEIVWHNGGTGGFRSFAGFSRKTGRGAVVLSNTVIGVDDLGFHLINSAFPLQPKPSGMDQWSTNTMVAAVVAVLVWLSVALMPFRARFSPFPDSSMDAATTVPKSRWQWAFKPRYITSRHDAAWLVAEGLAIAGLLYSFGPWHTFGRTLQLISTALLLVGAVIVVWRARPLMWRSAAPVGVGQIFARIVTALLIGGLVVMWVH